MTDCGTDYHVVKGHETNHEMLHHSGVCVRWFVSFGLMMIIKKSLCNHKMIDKALKARDFKSCSTKWLCRFWLCEEQRRNIFTFTQALYWIKKCISIVSYLTPSHFRGQFCTFLTLLTFQTEILHTKHIYKSNHPTLYKINQNALYLYI